MQAAGRACSPSSKVTLSFHPSHGFARFVGSKVVALIDDTGAVPKPLKRDVQSRAVDCFFVNWILHPGRKGMPGHMANLPALYYSAPPDSALAQAVRSVAIADVRHTYESGASFGAKARRSSGNALSRIREISELESELASVCGLADD